MIKVIAQVELHKYVAYKWLLQYCTIAYLNGHYLFCNWFTGRLYWKVKIVQLLVVCSIKYCIIIKESFL